MRPAFICTPEPVMGESTVGFLLRFANANGYEGLHNFKWPLRSMVGRMDLRTLTLMDLAESTGHHYELLKARLGMSYEPELDRYRYPFEFIRMVGKEAYNLVSPRVCPACLKEGNHLRLSWDRPLMVACEDHRLRLQDQCPQCSEQLSWGRRYFDRCDCGLELAAWKHEETDDALLEFQWLIFQYRTTERFVQKRWLRQLPKNFVHLPIDRLSQAVCRFVYGAQLRVASGKDRKQLDTYCLRASDMATGVRALLAFLKADPAFCLQMLHLAKPDTAPTAARRSREGAAAKCQTAATFRTKAIQAADRAFTMTKDMAEGEPC